MKKILIRTLQGIGIFLASIVGILVIALFMFAVVPEIVIPGSLIKKGLSFAPADAKLSYETIDIRLIKESFTQKKLQFVLKNVCIDYKEKALDSCFDELSGGASFKFLMPELKKVFPLRLINAYALLDLNRLSSDEPKQEESGGNPLEFLRREILPKWDFPGTLVELEKIEVITGKSKYVTSLFIDAVNEGSTALNLKVPDFREVNSGFPRANLKFGIRWPTAENKNYQSNGELNLQPSAKQAIALNLETQSPTWEDVAYDIKAKVNGIQPLYAIQLNGKYNPAETNGLLSVQLGGPQSEIRQLNFINCGYEIKLSEQNGSLKCGPQQVTLVLRERPAFASKPEMFRFSPTFELKITNFSYEKGVKTNFALDLDLEHLKVATADVNVDGSFDATGETAKYNVRTNTAVRVEDFKRLVAFLADTPAAIPAPVNVMGGKVNLSIDGAMNERDGKINFAFNPDLSSQYQRLLFTLGGRVELENRPKGMYTRLVLNSNLKDVKLSLPRLELAAPPQLMPDGRFTLAEAREKEKQASEGPKSGSTFAYDVDVQTPQVGSIAIATNLTKNPIPIGVDLNADSKNGVGPGEIEIGRVALELFRRKAFLEELDVELQADGDKFLKGNLTIAYLDYDIRIRVAGSVESPKIIMESTPPLSQDQIISVLLFGKAPDELDETQRSSVGNVSTAIADAALSFSSLYFLASTPVESVGYDAQRGVVTAKVGLGKGTSLELGSSGQDLSEVGVRRKLGQNWYLNSYVEEDSQTDERSVSAFIEWVRRF